jgi:hypothetical protein
VVDEKRGTYSTTQKMRAAITYMFGCVLGLGILPWHESELIGEMKGNPSVSQTLSSYMVSLHWRKVHSPAHKNPSCLMIV